MKTSLFASTMLAALAMASPAQPPRGPACHVDRDCKTNEHCDAGNCVPNRLPRDAPLAQLGQNCHVDADCVHNLACVKDVCAPAQSKRDVHLAQLNKPCKVNQDCVKGLLCQDDSCAVPKDKRNVSVEYGCIMEDCSNCAPDSV